MKKHGGKIDFAREVSDSVINGRPDLYNSPAKRVVLVEESQKMGWPHYYDGKTVCQRGHVAARYVKNPGICVDCKREAEGKIAIYPKTEFVDDLTGAPVYVAPVASSKFTWTEEKKRQLLLAWVNTRNLLEAIKVVGAQPSHVIELLRVDSAFKADYEAAERDVAQVQLWATEATAANGSERVQLAMATNKFPQFGAKTGLAGRPAVNSEQARAELTQLLSSARRSLAQRERLESIARASAAMGRTDAAAAAPADVDVEAPAVLERPHDNSDLVSIA